MRRSCARLWSADTHPHVVPAAFPGCRKVYDDTGDEVRPRCASSRQLPARVPHSRQQDALTGEQFDSLYRYYRNVYAKVRRCRCIMLHDSDSLGRSP